MIGFFNFASATSTIVISSTQKSKTDASTPSESVALSNSGTQKVTTVSSGPVTISTGPSSSSSSASATTPDITGTSTTSGSASTNLRKV
jgi:hypothetical protein